MIPSTKHTITRFAKESRVLSKVGARSGQKARLGQGWGRQGLGKVGARSGQKARLGQGWGRQGLGKVGARSGQASCNRNVFCSFSSLIAEVLGSVRDPTWVLSYFFIVSF